MSMSEYMSNMSSMSKTGSKEANRLDRLFQPLYLEVKKKKKVSAILPFITHITVSTILQC